MFIDAPIASRYITPHSNVHIVTLKRCGYRLNRLPLIFYMYSINDSMNCAKLIIMIYSLCIEFKMIERMVFGSCIASTNKLGSTNPVMSTWREDNVWFFSYFFMSLPEQVIFWILKRKFAHIKSMHFMNNYWWSYGGTFEILQKPIMKEENLIILFKH